MTGGCCRTVSECDRLGHEGRYVCVRPRGGLYQYRFSIVMSPCKHCRLQATHTYACLHHVLLQLKVGVKDSLDLGDGGVEATRRAEGRGGERRSRGGSGSFRTPRARAV